MRTKLHIKNKVEKDREEHVTCNPLLDGTRRSLAPIRNRVGVLTCNIVGTDETLLLLLPMNKSHQMSLLSALDQVDMKFNITSWGAIIYCMSKQLFIMLQCLLWQIAHGFTEQHSQSMQCYGCFESFYNCNITIRGNWYTNKFIILFKKGLVDFNLLVTLAMLFQISVTLPCSHVQWETCHKGHLNVP